jgi:CRISPR-associated protein Cas1
MALCVKEGILISFLSTNGRFWARVSGPVSGNVLLRKAQYAHADDLDKSAQIARRVVTAKAANCRTSLQRFARDYPTFEKVDDVHHTVQQLSGIIARLKSDLPLDVVRGSEGDAARRYFRVFDHLVVAQKDAFQFAQRTRRPPLDPINALLSFVYTLLVHDVSAACESVGLDPAVGFLHRLRPGRPSLALDLMEELRPVCADRLVLSLINRKQLKAADFSIAETGAVTMKDDARKCVLTAWQERKRESLVHPFLQEKVEIGLVPFVQARLLAKYLRGDLDDYPAFVWR